MAREVNLQTTFGTRPEDWRITLEMLRTGKISTEPLLHETDFVPLDDIQQAFEGSGPTHDTGANGCASKR